MDEITLLNPHEFFCGTGGGPCSFAPGFDATHQIENAVNTAYIFPN